MTHIDWPGAEFHGHYSRPGPSQHQERWALQLAEEHDLPVGTVLHILKPTNNPGGDHCGHLRYEVTRRFGSPAGRTDDVRRAPPRRLNHTNTTGAT